MEKFRLPREIAGVGFDTKSPRRGGGGEGGAGKAGEGGAGGGGRHLVQWPLT